MKDIELIKEYCKSKNNIEYLEKLRKYEKIFVKYSVEVLNGNIGNKKIAHDILTFFNYFDDGQLKNRIEKFDWIFEKDDQLDCSKILKKPNVVYRNVITINKINLQLLKSALQKFCRRNMTHKAIWCGLEWGLLRCDDKAEKSTIKSVITNLRNRLRIIYVEDTSIANINLLKLIDKNINKIDFDSNPNSINMDKEIVNIVSNISQSYHTRICSFVNSIYKIYTNKTFYEKQKEFISFFPNVKKCYEHIENNKHVSLEDNLYNTLLDKNIVSFYYVRKLSLNEKGKDIFGKKDKVFPIIRKVYNDLNKKLDVKLDLSYVDITQKWYNDIKNSEAFLMYFLPMLVICFPFKLDGRLPSFFEYTDEWKNLVMYNIEKPRIEFEQYVMDMHTKEGNKRGFNKNNLEGIEHFINQGAYVNDEYIPNDEYKELKNYYEFTKLLSVEKIDKKYLVKKKVIILEDEEEVEFIEEEDEEDKDEEDKDEEEVEFIEEDKDDEEVIIIKKRSSSISINEEIDIFKYIARAQVPTSGSKQDSYFAKMLKNYGEFKKDETVFIKGPFNDEEVYNILKLFIDIKKILNMPYVDVDKIDIKMSRTIFTDEINTNQNVKYYIRNKYNYENKYIFLIYKNLCGDDIYTTKYGSVKTQKSQAWIDSNTTIVNWYETNKKTKCKQFDTNDLKNINYMIYYIISIYFRYLFGIVDHANRNFLVLDDVLYSVDEENIDMVKESNFNKLEKNFEIINKNWDKVDKKIYEILKEWNIKITEIKDILLDEDYSKLLVRFNKIVKNPKFIFQ